MLLVTGFGAASRAAAIRHWADARPAGERWVVLTGGLGLQASVPDVFGRGVASFEIPGGCACCVAPPVLDATLGRLARAGPWDRVVLDLAPAGDPAAMIDALRAHPGVSGVRAVVAVVDAARDAPWTDADSPAAALARVQRDTADAMVLHRSACVAPDALDRLRAHLSESPFGARPVFDDTAAMPDWPPIRDAIDAWDRSFLGGGTPGCCTVQPLRAAGVAARFDVADGVRIAWRWPASVRFDRGALLRWWAALTSRPGLVQAAAAFRTEREWRGWSGPAGDPLGFTTHWRRDNRAFCTLRTDPAGDLAQTLLLEALASAA